VPAAQVGAAKKDGGGAAVPQETGRDRPAPEGHFPPTVADAVVACGQRFTVGVADGAVGALL
jgi:hypothetical protein